MKPSTIPLPLIVACLIWTATIVEGSDPEVCLTIPDHLCSPVNTSGLCAWSRSCNCCTPIQPIRCPIEMGPQECTCYQVQSPNGPPYTERSVVECLITPCDGRLGPNECDSLWQSGCRYLQGTYCSYAPSYPRSTLPTFTTQLSTPSQAHQWIPNQCPPGLPVVCEGSGVCAASAMLCTPCPSTESQCWDGKCVRSDSMCSCPPQASLACPTNNQSLGAQCAQNQNQCASCANEGMVLCPHTYVCQSNRLDCPCPAGLVRCRDSRYPTFDTCVDNLQSCVQTHSIQYSCPPETPVYCHVNGQCAETRNSCPCPADLPVRCPDVNREIAGSQCVRNFNQCLCPLNMRNCGQHCSGTCPSKSICQRRCVDSYGCDDGVTPSEPCHCVPYLFLGAHFPATMNMSMSDWNTLSVVSAQRYCNDSDPTGGPPQHLYNVSMTWYVYHLGPNGEQQYVDLTRYAENSNSKTLQLLPYSLQVNTTYRAVLVARDAPVPGSSVQHPQLASSVSTLITTYVRSPQMYFRGEQSRVVTVPRNGSNDDLVSIQLMVSSPCYGSSCFGSSSMKTLTWKSDEWDLVTWSCTFGSTNFTEAPCHSSILQQINGRSYWYNKASLRVVKESSFTPGNTFAITASYRGVVATQNLIVSYFNDGDGSQQEPGIPTTVPTASVNCQVVDLSGTANGQQKVFSRDVVACTIVFEVSTFGTGTQVITPDRTPVTIWELGCEDPLKNGESFTGSSLLLVPEGRSSGWREYISLPSSSCLRVSVKATTSVAYAGSNFAATDTYTFSRLAINTACTLGTSSLPNADSDSFANSGTTSVTAVCSSDASWPQLDWMVYHRQWVTEGNYLETSLLPFSSTIPLMTFIAPPPSFKGTTFASIVVVARWSDRPVFVSDSLRLNLTTVNSDTAALYISSQAASMVASERRWNVSTSGACEWANAANLMLAAFSTYAVPPTPSQWEMYIQPTLKKAHILAESAFGVNMSNDAVTAQRLSSQFVLLAMQTQSMLPEGSNVDVLEDLVASLTMSSIVAAVVDPNDVDTYLSTGMSLSTCMRNLTLRASVFNSVMFAVGRGLAASAAPGAGWELTYSPTQAKCVQPISLSESDNVSISVKGFIALYGSLSTTPQPFPVALVPNAPMGWGYQQQLVGSKGNAAVAFPDGLLQLMNQSSTTDTIPSPLSMSAVLIVSPPTSEMLSRHSPEAGGVSVVMHVEVTTDQGSLDVQNLPSTSPIWICVPVSPAIVAAACTSRGKQSNCPDYSLQYFDHTSKLWSSKGVAVPADRIVKSTSEGTTVCGYTTHLSTFAVVVGFSPPVSPNPTNRKGDDDDKKGLMSSTSSLVVLTTVCVATAALFMLAAFQYWRRQQEHGRKGLILEDGGELMTTMDVVVLPSKHRYPPSPRTRSASYPGEGYVPPPSPPTKRSPLGQKSNDSIAASSFNSSPKSTPTRGEVAPPTPLKSDSTSGTAQSFVVQLTNAQDKADVAQSLQNRASREEAGE